jgi:hypothetical protein
MEFKQRIFYRSIGFDEKQKRLHSRVAGFFLVQHTKRGKIHQMTTYNTKWPKIYLMVGKLTKLPQNIPTSSIVRPSKIYPNWNFWFENIPSGNPA